MGIVIPKRFAQKLDSDREWRSFVDMLIDSSQHYFKRSPFFFPEYTFHGTDHINRVMEIADTLIPNDTFDKITPMSLAILTSSIIVHDIGMFIGKDGLEKLLFGEYKHRKTEHLDSKSWEAAWLEYFWIIRRFSDKQLLDAFGTTEAVTYPHQLNSDELTEKDRKVYGEFLRQYHHRLAHEIAMYGFVGTVDNLLFDTKKYSRIALIIGLIARSHGMNMRDIDDYLVLLFGSDDNFKLPLGIPVYFLMSILRLSDYLDAGIERAPVELSDAQSIKSHISQGEWRWNQTINYNQCYRWDIIKQKLNIHANPTTSRDFIGVEKWLIGLQDEFDRSSAILSEYYSNEYLLTVRRITSNVFDVKAREYFNTIFVTRKAELKVNPEVLKLLVSPLYGNNPSYGIRELIQNAVDACNEREILEISKNYIGEVRIEIDKQKKKLTISDNGIGMNVDILLNYYLSVGSSYRYSDNWLKINTDENGFSKVIRTGRFGIGAISAFLLGDKLTVITQHIEDEKGYQFTFGIKPVEIDVERVNRRQGIGTTIIIDISDDIVLRLTSDDSHLSYSDDVSWHDWYHFKNPIIKYIIDNEKVHTIDKYVPNEKDISPGWFNLPSNLFSSYAYTFNEYSKTYCNGIIIPRVPKINLSYFGLRMEKIPAVSIIDRNTNLDVDLLRTQLISFPEIENLIEECYKYFIMHLLTIKNPITSIFRSFDDCERYLIYSNDGYTVYEPEFISLTQIQQIFVSIISTINFVSSRNNRFYDAYNLADYSQLQEVFRRKFKLPICIIERLDYGKMEKSSDNCNMQKAPPSELKEYVTKCNIGGDKFNSYWHNKVKSENTFILNIKYKNTPFANNNIMARLLKEFLPGDGWIPYDLSDRKTKYSKAFKELDRYIIE